MATVIEANIYKYGHYCGNYKLKSSAKFGKCLPFYIYYIEDYPMSAYMRIENQFQKMRTNLFLLHGLTSGLKIFEPAELYTQNKIRIDLGVLKRHWSKIANEVEKIIVNVKYILNILCESFKINSNNEKNSLRQDSQKVNERIEYTSTMPFIIPLFIPFVIPIMKRKK
ncbi:hypothetical protein Trydic_g22786 [Trypoxylus dichotomus]